MRDLHLKKVSVPIWILVLSYGLLVYKIYEDGEEAQNEQRKAKRKISKLQGEATRANTKNWKLRAAARR